MTMRLVLATTRVAAALVTAVLAFFGLLNWQAASLAISCTALVTSMWALARTGRRDDEWDRWTAGQLTRAEALGTAVQEAKDQAADELMGD